MVIELFGGRWKGPIIWWLRDERQRFSELQSLIPEVSSTVLTRQLRELERDGVVTRRQFTEMPVRVEYSLSPLGLSLLPVLDELQAWGREHLEDVQAARSRTDSKEN